jgi:hypothetical protein
VIGFDHNCLFMAVHCRCESRKVSFTTTMSAFSLTSAQGELTGECSSLKFAIKNLIKLICSVVYNLGEKSVSGMKSDNYRTDLLYVNYSVIYLACIWIILYFPVRSLRRWFRLIHRRFSTTRSLYLMGAETSTAETCFRSVETR